MTGEESPGSERVGGPAGRPLRVRHLIPSCMLNHGPSGGIIAHLGTEERAEFDSAVWSLYPPPDGRSAEDAVRATGAGVHTFDMSGSFLDLRVLRPLIRKLRQERPDVLHCHLLRANLYGRIAARAAGVPVVLNTLRNVEDYIWRRDPVSAAVRLVERSTLSLVSAYVAVSEGVRQAAIESLSIPPEKIVTILNAVDLTPLRDAPERRSHVRAELAVEEGTLAIASVGSLEPRKNQMMLLRLASRLAATAPPFVIYIIGDGPDRQRLEREIRGSGLQESVKLLGFRQDAARLMAGMDLFVMTSTAEGLPRAIMEAMASAVPCIVSDAGGNAEAVENGRSGYVHAVSDEDGMLASLHRLMSDAEQRARFSREARIRAFAKFTPDRAAREYAGLYRSLLAASAS